MAIKFIDTAPLADVGLLVSSAGGTTTNGIRVTWDNTKVSRHDIAVTLENIIAAVLIESQVTF